MKELKIGQKIKFRLDGIWEGEGLVLTNCDGFWEVYLTQRLKEFKIGAHIFVWDDEIFD